jgi:hypothetical protein
MGTATAAAAADADADADTSDSCVDVSPASSDEISHELCGLTRPSPRLGEGWFGRCCACCLGIRCLIFDMFLCMRELFFLLSSLTSELDCSVSKRRRSLLKGDFSDFCLDESQDSATTEASRSCHRKIDEGI